MIDGYTATITVQQPGYATDGGVHCPAIPKDEVVASPLGGTLEPIDGSTTEYKMHPNQGPFPTKGFAYCYQRWQENSLLAGAGYSGEILTTQTDNFNKEILYNDDGSFPIIKVAMSCADLTTGKDYVDLIKQVRDAATADPGLVGNADDKTDRDLFPKGVPFVFWEQYVTLSEHLLTKTVYAGLVCFGTVTILILTMSSESSSANVGIATRALSSVWGSLLVVLMCVISMIQMYGFMGLIEIKLNAIPQVTLVMAIGMTVEFTAHILLAFLLAPAPAGSGYLASRQARVKVAMDKMAMPSIHGAITTFLGIVVLYYFTLYALLVLFGAINGLIVLPAMLMLIGPPSMATAGSSGGDGPVEAAKVEGALEKQAGGKADI